MDNPIDPRIFSGHHLKKRMSWQWQDDQQRCMEGGEMRERPQPVQQRQEMSKSKGLAKTSFIIHT